MIRALLLRHPLHPALVHFPIACWTGALFADIAGWYSGEPDGWRLAYFLIAAGLLLALPAMLAGLLDLMSLGDDKAVFPVAQRHIFLMACAWLFYLTALMFREQASPPEFVAISCSVAGFLSLLAGAWHGGELVYRHGVGIRTGADKKT